MRRYTQPMVYRPWLGTALLLTACAPRVILSDESGGDSVQDTDVGSSESGGTDTPAATTSLPPVTTSGTPSTSGLPPATVGSDSAFDSSGFFGSSSGEVVQQCWSVQPLFEVPEQSRLFVIDQDGDGVMELWVAVFVGGGPGGGSELFRFGNTGQPNQAGFFPGFLTGFHNLNGDGISDATGLAFGGGGPPQLGYIEGIPQLVEGPVTVTQFGIEDGFEGFIDLNNDGLDDYLRNLEGGIEVLPGDGTGAFLPTLVVNSGLTGDIVPTPVAGNPDMLVVAQTAFFDDLSACSSHPFEFLTSEDGGELVAVTSSPDSKYESTEVLAAEHFGTSTNVYTRACAGQGVTMQIQRFEGLEVIQLSEYEPSSFATLGDFDGDGQDDIALGSLSLDTIRIYNGLAGGSFSDGQFTDALFGEPVPSRAFVLDFDGDGRDEIILGTLDGGSEIPFQRLDLDPC